MPAAAASPGACWCALVGLLLAACTWVAPAADPSSFLADDGGVVVGDSAGDDPAGGDVAGDADATDVAGSADGDSASDTASGAVDAAWRAPDAAWDTTVGWPDGAGDAGVDGAPAPAVPDELALAAQAKGRHLGAAVAWSALMLDPPYVALAGAAFTSLTAENAMKWGSLQPKVASSWDFSRADAIVAFAQSRGQRVRGHALVWHEALPPFVSASIDPKVLDKLIGAHIDATLAHFKGQVAVWDVVNEAVVDGGMRGSLLLDRLGKGFVAKAFARAAAADPKPLRYYNDYGVIDHNGKSDAMAALIGELVAAKVPIDGVGFQAHLRADRFPTATGILANWQRFIALGLELEVTELDVRTAPLGGGQAARWAAQAVAVGTVVAACAQVPACRGVSLWGVHDGYSWIDAFYGAPDDPLLFTEAGLPKPAYFAALAAWSGQAPEPAGPEWITDGGFEQGAAAGVAVGGTALAQSTTVHSGASALLVSQRTGPDAGFAVELHGKLQSSALARCTAMVRVVGAPTAQVTLRLEVVGPGGSEVVALTRVPANSAGWVPLGAWFGRPIPGATQSVRVHVAGPPAGVDLLIDGLSCRPLL